MRGWPWLIVGLIWWCLLGSLQAQTETQIGDPGSNYCSLEFSPDMRYIAWLEPTFGARGRLWLAEMQPQTGLMKPADGKGYLIAEVPFQGQPQWGQDADGVFLVAMERGGQLILARPNQGQPPRLSKLATPLNSTRMFPYPSRLSESPESHLIYLQKDASGQLQVFTLDTSRPEMEHQVTDGTTPMNGKAPIYLLTVPRWLAGRPIFSYPHPGPQNKLQISLHDVSKQRSYPVTQDNHDHVDDFPFLWQGRPWLIGGVDSQALGSLYEQAPGGVFRRVRNLVPVGSQLSNPCMASSFETFQWKEKLYACYQILESSSESRTPGRTPSEIWLTCLSKESPSRCLTPGPSANRVDPEYFLGSEKVWIYFFARKSERPGWELRRCETGL